MTLLSGIIIIIGLAAFETISSIDNAIINAEVLSTMKPKYQRRFLIRGILVAVFLVRGLLPWLIMYFTAPQLGFIESLTATFSENPETHNIIAQAAPTLMIGGGVFLIFLFLHRLFFEKKEYSFPHENFFQDKTSGFYILTAVITGGLARYAFEIDHMMAIGGLVGLTVFLFTNVLKSHAGRHQSKIANNSNISNIGKVIYLEIIDATFSIDGVLGAFAFTLSVPLILLGNGLGAYIVRRLTVHNIERIKKYKYLKNGAMYSICLLGIIMILKSFGIEMPERVSPIITFSVIGYFFRKSKMELKTLQSIIE